MTLALCKRPCSAGMHAGLVLTVAFCSTVTCNTSVVAWAVTFYDSVRNRFLGYLHSAPIHSPRFGCLPTLPQPVSFVAVFPCSRMSMSEGPRRICKISPKARGNSLRTQVTAPNYTEVRQQISALARRTPPPKTTSGKNLSPGAQ